MTLSVSPTADCGQSTAESALLAVVDVATLLAVSTRSVRRMADSGQMPRPLRLSSSLVRWRRSDLDEWLDAGCPRCDRRPVR